jgi:hypothetical protein
MTINRAPDLHVPCCFCYRLNNVIAAAWPPAFKHCLLQSYAATRRLACAYPDFVLCSLWFIAYTGH